jgi:alanine dehydrogenase
MSIQAGASHLEKSKGGAGILLGGVPGVAAGHIVIIGAGVVGTNALQMAVGIGARVTVLDKNVDRLRQLDLVYGNRISTLYSNAHAIEEAVLSADLVIGGVLVPGAAAPKLVTRDMVSKMKKGAVIVDVAIDQGGCFATSHPTTHADPTFVVDGVVHYCVANMPGAVARTSTFALNNATIAHAVALANKGWRQALRDDVHLKNGLNVCEGKVTYAAVAKDLGYDYVPADTLLA